MQKVIGAINITLDGFCDHTAVNPGKEVHDHYSDLLHSAGTILYGRITFQLMEFWPPLLKNPSGNKAMDDFAVAIDNIHKIVFSNTIKNIDWPTASLATNSFEEEVNRLQQQADKDILIGSRSLIIHALNLGLMDELQVCVHPVIAANGLPLFDKVDARKELQLLQTKAFNEGAVILYYQPVKK